MKKLFNINKWLVIITLVLYLTFYLGALFQIVLGLTQILMSLVILYNFKRLSRQVKKLFLMYGMVSVAILGLIFSGYIGYKIWIIVYLLIPMLLALFHLYITYRIQIES